MKIIVESKKTEFLTFMKYKDSEKKTYDISVLNKNSDTLLGKIKLDLVMLLKVAYLTGLSFEEIIREEIKLGFLDPKFYNLLGDKK